jgi:adenosylcobalamin-dependent ribonucleoside-triphosphate reductase
MNETVLTDEFIKKAMDEIKPPFTELGEFVLYRTYSRYLHDKKRRETWDEICKRSVEYNVNLQRMSNKFSEEELQVEAEELFRSMYGLKQFLSGRTLWSGGTDAVKKHPISNFNCAFTIIDDYDSISELFYLLMIGTGVGIRILKSDADKLNPIRTNIHVSYKYTPVSKEYRQDNTSLIFSNGSRVSIVVGDSKEGWVQALKDYLIILTDCFYKNITNIEFEFGNVRPKGERIKGFGGTASGHEALKKMFEKITKVLTGTLSKDYPAIINGKMRPIHLLDICNIIGENVVSGGVRRTSEIALISADDKECIDAKNGINECPDLYHRFMSNNSIFYTKRPTREQLREQFKLIRAAGEPCFINAETAGKRRKNFCGVNPCGEVLLDDKGLCNLTTINVTAFVKNGELDLDDLLQAQKRSVRAGVRLTLPTLELPDWDRVQKRDRLVGCSLTGWQDMVGMTNMSLSEQKKVLVSLRRVAEDEADRYANYLEIDSPLLVTTVKPEGTISQLPTVSSGVHFAHSKYFIRRVRITREDALCKTAEKLGWVIKPEVGQTMDNATTMVIEFPVKSESKTTKFDVGALEQLEIYKTFQNYYTQHNSSNTISVRNGEWGSCADWVYDNWDTIIGVTFLPLDEKTYDLAPYEAITEEQYLKMKSDMKPFDFEVLCQEERKKDEYVMTEILEKACESGACPLR